MNYNYALDTYKVLSSHNFSQLTANKKQFSIKQVYISYSPKFGGLW